MLFLTGQQKQLFPAFREGFVRFPEIAALCVRLCLAVADERQYHLILCPIPHITRSTSSASCASRIRILPVRSRYSLSNASTGTIPFPISSQMMMQFSQRFKNDCTSFSGHSPSDSLRLTPLVEVVDHNRFH